VVKNKRNTSAIEVAPSTLLAARMLEYKPASVKPLSDVQTVIQQKLAHDQSIVLATQQGKAALEQLQKSAKTSLSWSEAQTVTRGQHANLDVNLVRQVFQANAAKLPQYVGAEMAQGGYTIVRVDAVKEGDKPDETMRSRYVQQLRQLSGDEIFQAYLADAKARATIKINLPDTQQAKSE